MARVKAIDLCFVDNGLRQPGDVFNYDGPFNRHLEYLDGGPKDVDGSDEEPRPRLRPGRKPKVQTEVMP